MKKKHNNLIKQNASQSGFFLQSPQWKKFQESLGRKVFKIEDLGQFIKMPLVFCARGASALGGGKSYLYCPGKRIESLDGAQGAVKKLKKIAKEENAIFVRSGLFPSTTIILDLKKSEEELLNEMREKTRYNIRLSEKKGLEIETQNIASLRDFWKLAKETAKRQKIKNFSKNYYEKLLKIEDFAYLRTIYFKNKPLASGLFIDFAGTTTYLFGASTSEHKNLMAPYFLHWHIIKEAKKKGMKYYDFWGINPENKKDKDYLKKWEGITRFKKGFGGETVSCLGAFELPIQKGWYKIYKLTKMIKKILI